MSSLILQRFSERLNNPKVLTTPQEFLGPNTDKLFEFWLKIENLTEEQWRVVKERDEAFFVENHSEWDKAADLAFEAAKEVVGWYYADYAGCAAYVVTNFSVAYCATGELIGGVENPVFFKMFDNL